ncbi:unnamed protein product [Coccothraustes coccothraustes]
MQAHSHAEDANLGLSGPKRRSRVAFGRSRALECTASGTMLSARRSRSFASGSRGARLLLKQRVEKLSAKMQALRHTEDANLKLCGARRLVSGSLGQEQLFGEHCYRHNAQCAKKQLLPLLDPQSAAVAET